MSGKPLCAVILATPLEPTEICASWTTCVVAVEEGTEAPFPHEYESVPPAPEEPGV